MGWVALDRTSGRPVMDGKGQVLVWRTADDAARYGSPARLHAFVQHGMTAGVPNGQR